MIKRFILSDQVSTLPYRHKSLREYMFYKKILYERGWGLLDASQNEQESTQLAQDSSQQVKDSSQQAQDSTHQAQGSTQHAQHRRKHNQQQKNKQQKQQPTTTIPQTNTILNSSFNTPDPGFYQREYSEDARKLGRFRPIFRVIVQWVL